MKPFFTAHDADCRNAFPTTYPPGTELVPCIRIDKANRLLEKRGEIIYSDDGEYWTLAKNTEFQPADTHKALVINLEPIEQADSRDSLIKELAELEGTKSPALQKFAERAKKLLELK